MYFESSSLALLFIPVKSITSLFSGIRGIKFFIVLTVFLILTLKIITSPSFTASSGFIVVLLEVTITSSHLLSKYFFQNCQNTQVHQTITIFIKKINTIKFSILSS